MLKYIPTLACFIFIFSLASVNSAYSGMGNDAAHTGIAKASTKNISDKDADKQDQTIYGCGSPPPDADGSDSAPGADSALNPGSSTVLPSPTAGRTCNYGIEGFGRVASARVFYPCNMEEGTLYGATTLSGGMTNRKENLYWLAEELARRNIIVFSISARNNMTVSGYELAHTDAVGKIKEENRRSGSPVNGRIGHIGVSGFAMGGGATLNVSNTFAGDVDIAVAIAPYGAADDLSRIDCPVLTIIGTNDRIVKPSTDAEPAYQRLPDGIPKAYATLPYYRHLYWMTNGGTQGGDTSKLIAAWFRWAFYDDAAAFSIVQNPPGKISYSKKAGF